MATGSKYFSLFKSMIVKSRIKTSNLFHKDGSFFMYFDWNLLTSPIFKCFSYFNHDFAMFLFYNKIWFKKRKKVQLERLNVATHYGMRKSELVTKAREGDSKKFPRLVIGHKSNSLVLNATTARLGQSLDILGDFKLNLNTLENLRDKYPMATRGNLTRSFLYD